MNPVGPENELATYIDQTLLGPTVTRDRLIEWAGRSVEFPFASLCVPPWLVGDAYRIAEPRGIPICTVIGFPHGTSTGPSKVAETGQALQDGATEIDMVMNVGALLSGDETEVARDIGAVVAAVEDENVPGALVKVILSVPLLTDERIVAGCRLSVEAGASFVKSSTGFEPTTVTPDAISLMRRSVPQGVGVKASGGIRTREEAIAFIEAGANRIGSSSGIVIASGTVL